MKRSQGWLGNALDAYTIAQWARYRAVACTHPGCGARAGERCREASYAHRGQPMQRCHVERREAWQAAQAEGAGEE